MFARCVKWVMMFGIIMLRRFVRLSVGRSVRIGTRQPLLGGERLTSSVNYQLPPPINWNCLYRLVAAIITIIIPSSYYCAPVFMYIIHLYVRAYTHTQINARERAVHPLNSFKLLTNCPPDRELCAISSTSSLRRVLALCDVYNVYFTFIFLLLLLRPYPGHSL